MVPALASNFDTTYTPLSFFTTLAGLELLLSMKSTVVYVGCLPTGGLC